MTQISLWATAHKQEWDHEARAGIKTIQAEVWLKLQSAGVEEETSGETAEVEGRCAGVHCPQQFLQDIIKPLFVFRPPVHSISCRCNPPPNTWPPSLISFFAFPFLISVVCEIMILNGTFPWFGGPHRGATTHTKGVLHTYGFNLPHGANDWAPLCTMLLLSSPHVMETKFTPAWLQEGAYGPFSHLYMHIYVL